MNNSTINILNLILDEIAYRSNFDDSDTEHMTSINSIIARLETDFSRDDKIDVCYIFSNIKSEHADTLIEHLKHYYSSNH